MVKTRAYVDHAGADCAVAQHQSGYGVGQTGSRLMAAPLEVDEEMIFGDDLPPVYSEEGRETSDRILSLVEDTMQQLSETPLLKILAAHVADPVNDPLLGNMSGRSYDYLVSRARETYIDSRVESEFLKERLRAELNTLFEDMLGYVMMYAAGQALLYPKPVDDNPLFVFKDRALYHWVVHMEIVSARDAYLKSHAVFWSDLSAVLKSQQEIPSVGFRMPADPTADLPSPYGQGPLGVVLLPVPELLSWSENEWGGVREHIYDLMSLKKAILPEIEAMKSGRGAGEALRRYVTGLYEVFLKRGPRWESQLEEAVAYVTEENAKGNLKPRKPSSTMVRAPGISPGRVKRQGMEDAWLGGK